MKVDVLTEAVIAAPCDRVASYAADPTHAPEWYVNTTSADWQTPPPMAVGSRVSFVARFLGRQLAYTYEITVYEPGHLLVMRTKQGPFPMETTYTWEPSGEGSDRTRMTLRNRGEPRGFAALGATAMAAAMRRAQKRDLARPSVLLEQ